MTIAFILIIGSILYCQYRIEGRLVNLYSILMSPYLFIVIFNNLFFFQFGFYQISDKTLTMLLASLLLFYIGGLPFILRKRKRKRTIVQEDRVSEEKLTHYNIKNMTLLLYIIGIISIVRFYALFRSGTFNSDTIGDAEGMMKSGIVGHLLNLSYVVPPPIVFLYWTYHKKQIYYLIPIILTFASTFFSLIKYNIISLFVILFIEICLYRPKLVKKSVLYLLVFTCFIFFANYYTTSSIVGVEFSTEFYLGHFWKYVGGSLIVDNYIFDGYIPKSGNIWYTLMRYLSALPNMFLSLFDVKIFPCESSLFYTVSEFGEDSNVTDAFGSLYRTTNNLSDSICYFLVIMLIGFIAATIYYKQEKYRQKFNIFLIVFLTYFIFFSFFGTFYILPTPWEILVYSAIIPNLFYRKTNKVNNSSL